MGKCLCEGHPALGLGWDWRALAINKSSQGSSGLCPLEQGGEVLLLPGFTCSTAARTWGHGQGGQRLPAGCQTCALCLSFCQNRFRARGSSQLPGLEKFACCSTAALGDSSSSCFLTSASQILFLMRFLAPESYPRRPLV